MSLGGAPPREGSGKARDSAEEPFDPANRGEALRLSRRIVEDAVGYLRDVLDRSVWREAPENVRAFFAAPLPRTTQSLADVYRDVAPNVTAWNSVPQSVP